jgi:glycosyltransferase involved in cell wall biosynthesis
MHFQAASRSRRLVASRQSKKSAVSVRDAGLCRQVPWAAEPPWSGSACDAGTYLGERIKIARADGHAELPRQMAILWEQRPDLRHAYDLTRRDGYDNYIVWCLTTGIEDGLIAPELIEAAFWDELNEPAPVSGVCDDLPVSRALAMLYAARYPAVPAFAVPSTWLELALWALFTASRRFRWPKTMMKSVRDYAEAPLPLFAVCGVSLPCLILMVWKSRADLRVRFDLLLEDDRRNLLYWLLFDGLGEYGISRDDLPEDFLRRVLDRNENDALPLAHRLLCRQRPDLVANFDIGSEAGQSAYLAWFKAHGIRESGCERLFVGRLPTRDRTPTHSQVEGAAGPPPIVLTGRVNDPSGRGEDIRMTMRALNARRVPFVTLDRDDGLVRAPDGRRIDPGAIVPAKINILHLNADSAFADHQFLRRHGIGNTRLIGYWAWELAKFPAEFVTAFSFVDEIWAASRFAFGAFDIGYRPVHLMPMAVETSSGLGGATRSRFRLPLFRFLFLFSFDFNSHVARKNPAAVIAAFRQAFPHSCDRASLILKTINGGSSPAEWRRLQNLVGGDRRIVLRDLQYTRDEIGELMRACDCYVSLHRAEGFGRGPAEAMLLGKPVIATNYSGNTDFMNADNSFLVEYRLVTVGEDEYPGARGQVWAEPDIARAAAQMRRVYDDADEARRVGERAQCFMRDRFNADAIGRRYLVRLSELEPDLAAFL